jgi:hypothetical protein
VADYWPLFRFGVPNWMLINNNGLEVGRQMGAPTLLRNLRPSERERQKEVGGGGKMIAGSLYICDKLLLKMLGNHVILG